MGSSAAAPPEQLGLRERFHGTLVKEEIQWREDDRLDFAQCCQAEFHRPQDLSYTLSLDQYARRLECS